jgi:Bacterial lipid A biosynthesis acyltransferase
MAKQLIPSQENNRLSRPGTSRSSGPDRRDESFARNPSAIWELWTLRALWPEAEWDDLLEIKARQGKILAREREALAGLWAGDRSILAPGRRLLKEHPSLKSGLVVSFHQGPYQLLAEPYLEAGLEPVILLNSSARDSFREPTRALMKSLGHRGKIQWVAVGDPGFVRNLIQAVRDQRPVLVYLDGNSGEEGMQGTRSRGLTYSLPGRDIRVRTGLARLVSRLQCPVHPVALHWADDGQLIWEKCPSQNWSRRDDPNHITRLLFDWCFSEIIKRPHQWQYWAMLRESSACFTPGVGEGSQVPKGLRDDFIHGFNICLERSADTVKLLLDKNVEVWPGGVLADLTDDRFYPADGMQDQDLQSLRDSRPTLAELCREHGIHWVKFHGLRLCLLGMARLGG